jgi:hypothetical protein
MAYDFKKSDMNQQKYGYVWTASKDGDNAKITGFPDNVLLSRKEGYEVLHFIKRYVDKRSWQSGGQSVQPGTGVGQHVELRIHEAPADKKTHKAVEAWVEANW